MYINNLNKIIRYERKSWGMSKYKLSKKAHVDINIIEEIESGKNDNPDFFIMLNLCEALDISVFSLLKDKYKNGGFLL